MAMRLGTDEKKKRLIAMVLVPLALTAIAYIVWNFAAGPSAAPAPPPAAQLNVPARTSPNNVTLPHAAEHLESASSLDPTLHPERMALAENTKYTGTSRNIFSKDSMSPAAISAIEKPIASVRTTVATGPPPPPPINLKFYGFAMEQNGEKMVFLLDGEDVFIAKQGDIVDGRYKVVRIENGAVVVDDLSYNNEQTLPLQTS